MCFFYQHQQVLLFPFFLLQCNAESLYYSDMDLDMDTDLSLSTLLKIFVRGGEVPILFAKFLLEKMI